MQMVLIGTAASGLNRTTERWDVCMLCTGPYHPGSDIYHSCLGLSLEIEGPPLMVNQEWVDYPLLVLEWVPWMALFHVEDLTDHHPLISTHRGDRGALRWCPVSRVFNNIPHKWNQSSWHSASVSSVGPSTSRSDVPSSFSSRRPFSPSPASSTTSHLHPRLHSSLSRPSLSPHTARCHRSTHPHLKVLLEHVYLRHGWSGSLFFFF